MPTSRATAKRSVRKKRSAQSKSGPSRPHSARKKKQTLAERSASGLTGVTRQVPVNQVLKTGASIHPDVIAPILNLQGASAVVSRGDAGDHPGVQRFLQSVQPEISPEAFAATLEEPLYEPTDRIVARLGTRVVGHALVSRRDAYLGNALTPVVRVSQVTILPELRGQGLGPKLLHAVEERISQEQAALGLLATARSAFFEQHGWLPVAAVRRSQLTTRNLVGVLESKAGELSGRWRVRPWRQMEYGALEDLYQNTTRDVFAAFERTEAFWRWVVGSCNPARLLVACDHNQADGGELAGYVILRGESILEVAARNNRPDVLHALLHRACVEAIERSVDRLEFEASADHPAHRMLGYDPVIENGHGTSVTLMAKVLDRQRLLQALSPAIDDRAKAAGMERPCELGFRVTNESPCRLVFQPRSVKLANSGLGRSYLRCTSESFARTLLGRPKHGDSPRFRGSTERAKAIASKVFPMLPAQYCGLEY